MVYINYKLTLISLWNAFFLRKHTCSSWRSVWNRRESKENRCELQGKKKNVPWRAEEMKAVNTFVGDLFLSLQKANQVPGKIPVNWRERNCRGTNNTICLQAPQKSVPADQPPLQNQYWSHNGFN